MSGLQKAFQIERMDNVATALMALKPGTVTLLGDGDVPEIEIGEPVMDGHKIALCDIENGQDIIKYGVVIGRATRRIEKGTWVHLHCMRSVYDERSSHLDVITGAPKDIKYE